MNSLLIPRPHNIENTISVYRVSFLNASSYEVERVEQRGESRGLGVPCSSCRHHAWHRVVLFGIVCKCMVLRGPRGEGVPRLPRNLSSSSRIWPLPPSQGSRGVCCLLRNLIASPHESFLHIRKQVEPKTMFSKIVCRHISRKAYCNYLLKIPQIPLDV